MLLTGLSLTHAAHHWCPVEADELRVGLAVGAGAGATRFLAGMLNAEDGAHMAPGP